MGQAIQGPCLKHAPTVSAPKCLNRAPTLPQAIQGPCPDHDSVDYQFQVAILNYIDNAYTSWAYKLFQKKLSYKKIIAQVN